MRRCFLILIMICIGIAFSSPVSAVEINAFGDITLGDSTKDGEPYGFSLGQFVLWGTQKIDRNDKLKTFFELAIESPGGGFVVDLERLWVEYSLIPGLRVRGGRFHTSMGYWNRLFHHGAHMQTTVFRPLFLDFEDGDVGILPSHMIGVMGVYDHNMAAGDIHFELQIGNGSYFDGSELNPANVGDVDEGKGIASKLVFSPAAVEGLGIGISYITNPVSIWGTADTVKQNIVGMDLSYVESNMEVIFEYYSIGNKQVSTEDTFTSSAYYLQAGYTIDDYYTPYARYEFFDDLDTKDPYFTALSAASYTQIIYGARVDLDVNSAIKIEGRSLTETPGDPTEVSSESYWLQWTFAF